MRRLDRLFGDLQHYAKVIEVLYNGTPYIPWLWAPIKLILQAGVILESCSPPFSRCRACALQTFVTANGSQPEAWF